MPIINPPRIEILDEGASQGRVTRMDFTGSGIAATVAGELATINSTAGGAGDISLSLLAPLVDETITAGYSAYLVDFYEVALDKFLEVGLGSVFEIG